MSLSNKRPARASAGSRTASWAEQAAPRRWLDQLAPGCAQAAWLAMLVAVPAAMNPAGAGMFQAGKLAVAAPLGALLLAACIAGWRRAAPTGGMAGAAAPLRALAAFLFCALIATCASDMPWSAFFGGNVRREGLLAWGLAVLPGLAMLVLLRDGVQLRRVIDALLLASVVPCLYAWMQRYGAVPSAGLDVAGTMQRPWGTLGNPVFLGDLLLLLMPLCLARVLVTGAAQEGKAAWGARLPWLLLLLAQGWTLLLTQSRAPLAGTLFALWLFTLLLAALRGSRRLALAAAGALGAGVLGLVLLNTVPLLGKAAQGVPGLQRLVFADDLNLSGVSRLGIWQAGVEAIGQAPVARMITGYGFDVVQQALYAHVPARVLQIEGPTEVIDRLHNEPMELALSVGWPGLMAYMLFLGLLLRAAHGALARGGEAEAAARGRRLLWSYLLAPWPFAVAGAWVAGLTGYPGLAGLGFGAGAGLAWLGLLLWQVGQALARPGVRAVSSREIYVAALAATVLAFWFDAQISLPVLATRMVLFTLAALLLLLAGGLEEAPRQGSVAAGDDGARGDEGWAWGWMAGVITAMGIVAFVPTPFGWLMRLRTVGPEWAQVLLLLAPGGLAWLWYRAAGGAQRGGWRTGFSAFGAAFALGVLPAGLGYGALALGLHGGAADEVLLGAPVLWVWGAIVVSSVVAGVVLARAPARKRAAAAGNAPPLRAWLLGLIGVPLVAAALWMNWAQLRADVLVRLAGWVQMAGPKEKALPALQRSAQILPGEPQHLLALGGKRVERVLEQLPSMRGRSAQEALFLADELRAAEADLRAALALAPGDPWVVLGLANALQLQGSRGLRPLMGEQEGAAKAAQARELFARAQRLFPAQPTILRNWAQLEFDGGDREAAYRLLDRMEQLAPASEEPYLERMMMAVHLNDTALLEQTYQRAQQRLDKTAQYRLATAFQARVKP